MARRQRRRDAVTNRRLPTRRSSTRATSDYGYDERRNRYETTEFQSRLLPYRQKSPSRLFENVNNRKSVPTNRAYLPKLRVGQVVSQNLPQRQKSLCEQRQTRVEVIHATGNAGRRGQRSPIWTRKSKVRCK